MPMFFCDVSVANENVSLVISRQILSEFCSCFSSLPDAVGKEVAHFTLEKVQPRVVSFEEQVYSSTEILCECRWSGVVKLMVLCLC